MVSSHLQQTLNLEVFKIKMSDLLFILPNSEMRDFLNDLLQRARSYNLISREEIDRIINNQILTYEEYCERHCNIHTAVEASTEPGMYNSESSRMSELMEESPLSSARGRYTLFPRIGGPSEDKLSAERGDIAGCFL